MSEVVSVNGKEGDFTVAVTKHPRYVDPDKCIACGLCAEKCPKKVPDRYNAGLGQRKAIYIPYSQAVPQKYTIDPHHCIYLTKGKCGACEKNCPTGAINFDDAETRVTLRVGAIVLAPGFQSFDPSGLDNYRYVESPDVVTSPEFERILSATGPSAGQLLRPSSLGKKKQQPVAPRKIAWLQCVGSRDVNQACHAYCSSVCCMYALKQSVMAKEHSPDPLTCAIFYMDLRAAGKDFDRYLESAAAHGVRLVRARVHSVLPGAGPNDLLLRYADENGRVQDEPFDLVVLSTGLEISRDTMALADRLGVELDADRFTRTSGFAPVQTSVPGIYACGAFTGPKDIPQSVMEASAAACAATENLSSARHSRTHSIEVPPERDVTRAKPRIGVFVCNCGINIGGVVRVPEVAQYAASLPGVAYVEENLFTCSQDTQVKISDVIREKGLNRVVIAACTPRTHEALFQETLTSAGLNKYLVEMANIRNHDSWVHADDPDAATRKAKDLVAMAVAKAALAPSLQETELAVNPTALVVGGGVAGMHAALAIAHQGYPVHLVEKSDRLGGNAQRLLKTAEGEDVRTELNSIIDRVAAEEKISVHLNTTVSSADGFVGNFSTTLADNRQTRVIEHGVTILATGAREYRPDQYLCGEHPAVLTHLEMDSALRGDDPRLEKASDVVFIQCVGSRNAERPYCSKVCCTHSLTSAIELKMRYPDINVYILYRDIRAYGQREALYQEARRRGILFFRYTADQPPVVSTADRQVRVLFEDSVIGRQLAIDADLLCLAAAIEPNDIQKLARAFKVPVDADGWLQEAHFKLRPVDMASDGIFLCGMAHYPKPLDESISQAQAAAARAVTVLSRGSIRVGGSVARIDPDLCSGCLGCINVCPYGAITFDSDEKVAVVNAAVCKGCGACAAACPSEAAVLMGFDNRQLYAQIDTALSA